jgi:hypothetical protein
VRQFANGCGDGIESRDVGLNEFGENQLFATVCDTLRMVASVCDCW